MLHPQRNGIGQDALSDSQYDTGYSEIEPRKAIVVSQKIVKGSWCPLRSLAFIRSGSIPNGDGLVIADRRD